MINGSILVMLALLVGAREAPAQDSLRISSSSAFLTVQTVLAGNEPAPIVDSASTYSVTSSTSSQKITASLDGALPPGVSLAVKLEAPSGATSFGMVTMTTQQQDVVANLPVGSSSNLRITYRFTGTLAAGVVPTGSRSVTFTLKPGP